MARAVNVGIVAGIGLIFHVSGIDGDAALLLLGGLIDGVISLELGLTLHSQILGDGGGQGGLAVVNVADGADVDMGLGTLKFSLSHFKLSSLYYNYMFQRYFKGLRLIFYRIAGRNATAFSASFRHLKVKLTIDAHTAAQPRCA